MFWLLVPSLAILNFHGVFKLLIAKDVPMNIVCDLSAQWLGLPDIFSHVLASQDRSG